MYRSESPTLIPIEETETTRQCRWAPLLGCACVFGGKNKQKMYYTHEVEGRCWSGPEKSGPRQCPVCGSWHSSALARKEHCNEVHVNEEVCFKQLLIIGCLFIVPIVDKHIGSSIDQ